VTSAGSVEAKLVHAPEFRMTLAVVQPNTDWRAALRVASVADRHLLLIVRQSLRLKDFG